MKRMAFLGAVWAAVWTLTATAEIRMWTSATGTQIEAELVEMQDGHAVLRTGDGREFRIQISALSQPDQDFIQRTKERETPAAPVPVEEPAPRDTRSSRRDRPTQAPEREPGDWDRVTGRNVFAAPDPITTDIFANLSPDNLHRSVFIGLQYGPSKTDVLYYAFEIADSTRPAEILHIYAPGLPPHQQHRTLKGSRRTVEKERVIRFRDIKVDSLFDDIRFTADIEFFCGFGRGDTVLLVANSKLERGRTASTFVVGGYINDDAQYGSGMVKTIPMLATPRAAVVARIFGAPVLYGSCAMNRLSVIPKSGMNTKLEISVIEVERERSVEITSLDIREDRLLSGKPDRTINYRVQNMERGRRYEVELELDLGPFLGPVKQRIRFM